MTSDRSCAHHLDSEPADPERISIVSARRRVADSLRERESARKPRVRPGCGEDAGRARLLPARRYCGFGARASQRRSQLPGTTLTAAPGTFRMRGTGRGAQLSGRSDRRSRLVVLLLADSSDAHCLSSSLPHASRRNAQGH